MLPRLSLLARASVFVFLAAQACAPALPAASPPPSSAPAASGAAPIAAESSTPKGSASASTQLEFPITGSPGCQRLFREGMLAMHSFQYDQAHESFAAALAKDPGCAMASWGDAMTYEHPIWHERDVSKAKAALGQITPAQEKALGPKERAHLVAARALFAVEDTKVAHEAWLEATAKMRAEYPDDDEIALQHVLALLAVYGYEPLHQREQSEAGAIALDVLGRRPEHPGAAHYVIHAFDNREHAILALPAARTYARIAPTAGHALHMPSHTFTHLGMWRDVVPSNERAYASSQAWSKAHGESPGRWDWHSYSWLVAAHLELGQPARAKQLVDEARALLAKDDVAELRAGYASVAENYAAQSGHFSEVEALTVPLLARISEEAEDGHGPIACAMHAPGGGGNTRPPFVLFARLAAHKMRAEAAIRAGDAAAAEARAKDIVAVNEQMKPWAKMGRMIKFIAVDTAYVTEINARARLVRSRTAATEKLVLDAIEQTAQREDVLGTSGPAFSLIARERLGEAFLTANKSREALAQYDRVLEARPNRALSLLGAARSARAAGDATKARAHYTALADLWRDADAALPALAEVRAGAR